MSKPRITVYIPSHNYGRFLSEAIESVLRQSVTDWELFVIDDGSTDETAAVMKLYEAHPQIKLFSTGGIGLTAVCNLALSCAQGDYIVRLDGDDVFDENLLLVLGHVLESNPEMALVFADYYLVDPFGEVYSHERRKKLYVDNHTFDAPPHGACTLIRLSVLKEVGGYREDLKAQDGFDLWSKIVERYKSTNVNLPLFYYRQHGNNLTTNAQRIFNARRQIKKDFVRDKLKELHPVIAVIPCRRNFDFVTDLWNESLGGKTLLEREIQACLSSDLFNHVVVASDNPLTEDTVRKFYDSRLDFVLRDSQSTIRSASIVPTLESIAKKFDPELNGITVIRYLQSPFVTVDSIEEGVATLVMSGADSSTAVEEIFSQVFRRSRYGMEPVNRQGDFRSDFDLLYRDLLSCVATYNRNFRTGSLTGRSIVSYVMPPAECMTIDTDQKMEIARIVAGGSN
jgi:glycosyltransferase involved in cell wall biosynthesis